MAIFQCLWIGPVTEEVPSRRTAPIRQRMARPLNNKTNSGISKYAESGIRIKASSRGDIMLKPTTNNAAPSIAFFTLFNPGVKCYFPVWVYVTGVVIAYKECPRSTVVCSTSDGVSDKTKNCCTIFFMPYLFIV